ncbi:MAG: glycosyltransferase, partial [Microbacteriaceae bacterium]|nr:glycosyltransferase [Microbacteriaceae bacterium]
SEPVLRQLEAAGVRVLRQPEICGIGAAINRGCEDALSDAECVVTFDQDSRVAPGFVDALVDEHDRAVEAGLRVAMVCPEYYSLTSQAKADYGQAFLEAYGPIQSGMLMPAAAIRELGGQREDFFIDLIDTEYYLRAVVAGFAAICARGLTLPHGFGHPLYVHFLGRRLHKPNGRPRMVAVSSPFRYYYRARNRIVLNRLYGMNPTLKPLLRRDFRNDVLLDYLVAIWSARGKWSLLTLIVTGLRHGARGKLGKIPSRLAARAARISWKHPVVDPAA